MSIILYGGDKSLVEKQLKCKHQWHGPCIDNVSRYYKCTKCFCLERDLNSLDAYWEAQANVPEKQRVFPGKEHDD